MSTEPAGARMQVVKGCSRLSYDWLKPLLRPRDFRREIEVDWPKWGGGYWTLQYRLNNKPCVTINFWPDGRVALVFYADDGRETDCTLDRLAMTSDTPLEELLGHVGECYAGRIAAHLNAAGHSSEGATGCAR